MKKNLIKWGCMLLMCTVSFAVKAEKFAVSLTSQALGSLSMYEPAYIEDISEKISADVRFKELVNLEIAFGKQLRSLSSNDKKLLMAAWNEKNISALLKLFSKAGVDFKTYSSKKIALVTAVFKEYGLDKRSDQAKILRSATQKLNLTEFADCLNLWSTGLSSCDFFPDDYKLLCFSLVTDAFIACIAALP
ncbi:MAG: hypothetical protein JO301_03470 [Chitinophagaceae bacterium]|nr:hypothetical protein [Chitinophagaceae bacterium]